MKLYHFTPRANYDVILGSDAIRPGNVAMPNRSVQAEHAVSLTRAPNPQGLGIPTGSPIPPAVFSLLQKRGPPYDAHEVKNGKPYQRDHSEVRLRLAIPNGPALRSARAFYGEAPKVLAALAASASQPLGVAHLTEEELDALAARTTPSSVANLTKSWWYHFGPIPLGMVDEVALKDARGFYKSIALPPEIVAAKARSGGEGAGT